MDSGTEEEVELSIDGRLLLVKVWVKRTSRASFG